MFFLWAAARPCNSTAANTAGGDTPKWTTRRRRVVVRSWVAACQRQGLVAVCKDFTSRVVLLASSEARGELRCRVAPSGVTGRVSGPLSSRAGLAHRDCPPQCRPPVQSPFHLAVAFAPVGLSLKESLCRRWPSCLGTGGKANEQFALLPVARRHVAAISVAWCVQSQCHCYFLDE